MSCPPPRPPKVPFVVTPAEPEAAEKPSCEVNHSMCLQCGTEMNLIKTKWICPKCKWIIGCCD